MVLWIATGNKGKVREFQLLLQSFGLRFLSDVPGYLSPQETGASYEENARIKARSLKHFLEHQNPSVLSVCWILGEDSGLTVPAIGNAPGIYSARYNGPSASDSDNIRRLMCELQDVPKSRREAYFTSHIIAISPDGEEFSCEGIVNGRIADTYEEEGSKESKHSSFHHWPEDWPRFGYDPVFIPKGEPLNFFELGLAYKNQCSHRFLAVQKLKPILKKHQKAGKEST